MKSIIVNETNIEDVFDILKSFQNIEFYQEEYLMNTILSKKNICDEIDEYVNKPIFSHNLIVNITDIEFDNNKDIVLKLSNDTEVHIASHQTTILDDESYFEIRFDTTHLFIILRQWKYAIIEKMVRCDYENLPKNIINKKEI